jgi:hypothetical protein
MIYTRQPYRAISCNPSPEQSTNMKIKHPMIAIFALQGIAK